MPAFSAPRRGFSPKLTALILLASAAVAACSDRQGVEPMRLIPSTGTLGSMAATSCGASFRMISTEEDTLMTPYGIANTVDTVDICETWTGSDYAYQATEVGSSDNIPELPDDIQTSTYENGYVTGYSGSGSPTATASSVGATAFDFLYADDATRQASYDYPYYGVASPDPTVVLMSLVAGVDLKPKTGSGIISV